MIPTSLNAVPDTPPQPLRFELVLAAAQLAIARWRLYQGTRCPDKIEYDPHEWAQGSCKYFGIWPEGYQPARELVAWLLAEEAEAAAENS